MADIIDPESKMIPVGQIPEEEIQQEEAEPELILGKFKNPDEVVTGYAALQQKFGEQGTELSQQRQTNDILLKRVETMESQLATPLNEDEKQAEDYDSQVQAISNAVEEGDLEWGQALVKMSQLGKEEGSKTALSTYKQLNEQQELEANQRQFMTENPDFNELYDSGALDADMTNLQGVHSPVSAYFAYKLKEQQTNLEAQQKIEKIATGDKRTEKVLETPSDSQPNKIGRSPTRLSGFDMKQSMLKAIS